MKIVFMGTPEFAASILKSLSERHEVLCVVTQPDKPVGRSSKLTPPPVKVLAESLKIPVFQPERIKSKNSAEFLAGIKADLFAVAAYGQILSKKILDMPKCGCINVHASLLPKYRGAAPIQWAIANGEEKTGITVMKMDEGLDTGDMLLKAEIPILKEDTGGSLTEKLQKLGGSLLIDALENFDSLKPEKQDDSKATYAPLLRKDTGHINWNKPSESIVNTIRAFDPFPSAYTYLNQKMLKIWKAVDVSADYKDISVESGVIADIIKNRGFVVKTGENGAVLATEVQALGKKRMSCADFLRGTKINVRFTNLSTSDFLSF